MNNKKLLVVSNNAFSRILNNGKTYESFFKDWEKRNLAQFFFCTNEYPDFSFCDNYFKITEIDVFKSVVTFNLLKRGGVVVPEETAIDNGEIPFNQDPKILRFLKKNAKTLALFRDFLWAPNSWKTKALKKWIEDFKPDFVFYVSGEVGFAHKVVQWIHKKYNIPYAVYFTDDYVINQHSDNVLQKIYQKTLYKRYRVTIQNASKCYVVSQLMADDYTKMYSKKFAPLVNCIDFDSIKINEPKKVDLKELKFSYIGGLHLNRWKSIVEIGSLLLELENELNIKSTLKVFAVHEPDAQILRKLNTYPIKFEGALDDKGVLNQIEQSDILIHVESMETRFRLYTKYSVSTKIPEYLSSNRCVLALGPHEVASIKLLAESNTAVVLTDMDNKDEMKEKLKKMILNENYRNDLCERAFIFAKEHFDAKKMRRMLEDDLIEMLN